MKNKKLFLLAIPVFCLIAVIFLLPKKQAVKEHAHEHGHEKAEGPGSIKIDNASATASDIKVDIAGPQVIKEMATLTGRVGLNRNTTANVKARFAGLVRQVEKKLGDQVKAGELLAKVESNDSLRIYPVVSPINGTILSLQTNVGDVADENPLFIIADLSDLWAEFHVFPDDIGRVAIGQKIRVASVEGGIESESVISSLLPLIETSTQTVVARVPLNNQNGQWRAGMTVQGRVEIGSTKVDAAVKSSALQSLRNSTVVFTKVGETYGPKEVKIGVKDNEYVEIIHGIKSGDTYVSGNSFLIKADIEKSGAGHDH